MKQVFQVTSGDPSRGTISLESHAAPPEGSIVQVHPGFPIPRRTSLTSFEQLCHLERPTSRDALPTREPGIQFFSHPREQDGCPDEIEITEGAEGGFVAGSENGVLVDEGHSVGPSWKCTLAGARCSLSW